MKAGQNRTNKMRTKFPFYLWWFVLILYAQVIQEFKVDLSKLKFYLLEAGVV